MIGLMGIRALGGAVTQTFPSPNGWTTDTPEDGITSLTHLNISNITKHFTTPHIRGLRPNCEAEWANPDPKHHYTWGEIRM